MPAKTAGTTSLARIRDTSVMANLPTQAIPNFSASGFADGSFVDLSGTITSVSANANPGYSFASLAGGNITLDINKTGTDYTAALGSSGMVINNSGFGFQQSALAAEPVSSFMVGIGLSSLFAYRRSCKRIKVLSKG
jgi:hypothetical protein